MNECTGKTYKLMNMPEGHVIHRLAHAFNQDFRGVELEVSSPQGRFSEQSSQLDGHQLERAEAWGSISSYFSMPPRPSQSSTSTWG